MRNEGRNAEVGAEEVRKKVRQENDDKDAASIDGVVAADGKNVNLHDGWDGWDDLDVEGRNVDAANTAVGASAGGDANANANANSKVAVVAVLKVAVKAVAVEAE